MNNFKEFFQNNNNDDGGKETNKEYFSPELNFKFEMKNIEECKQRAPTLIRNCYDLLTSNKWKLEKITTEGDAISYMTLPETDQIFYKITGTVDISAEKLINHLYDHIESSPTWNNHVEESKRICIIDEKTDVVYQAAKSFGKGLIGARDFVILRHQGQFGSYFINGNISLNDMPKRKNFIRAENGIGCFATQNLSHEKNKCRFIWILNTDIKGWIPRRIVNMCTSIGFVDFMHSLRLHVKTIKED